MKPKVLLPKDPDDTVTLCPLVDFRALQHRIDEATPGSVVLVSKTEMSRLQKGAEV